MLKDHVTVSSVVSSGLCMSCGICEASCHVKAIKIINDAKMGMFVPQIDEEICDVCDNSKVGKCVIVCPGVEVNFTKLNKKFIGASKSSSLLGQYDKCYYSHAIDDEIRYKSSSGGLVTSLLLFALEQNLIDGVAVITMVNGLQPEGIVARTKEDILAAAGSKYCPSHLGDAIREISEIPGRYAVVGLPCHIHGLRKMEKIHPELTKRILYHFGLYCANNNTFHATDYFLRENEIVPETVTHLRYRGNGWPGQFSVTLDQGDKLKIKRGTTETDKKRRSVFSSAFHYDFQIPRCLTCDDLTAELADISFADPWNKKFMGSEKVGKSMLVVRNKLGDELLKLAADRGVICLEEADSEEVEVSQNIRFKQGASTRLRVLKKLGKATPHYTGRPGTFEWHYVWNFMLYTMSFVAKNKWTIKLLPIVQLKRRVFFKLLSIKESIVGFGK